MRSCSIRTRFNARARRCAQAQCDAHFPASKAFRLYDTYGLPRDFIEDVAARRGHCSRLGRLRTRHGGAAHSRARFLERRAQGSRPIPRTRNSRKLSRPSRIFTSARSTRDCRIEAIVTKARPGKRNQSRRRSRNRSRPHLDLLRIRRPGRRHRRASTTIDSARKLAEVSGAYYPVSRPRSRTASSPKKICTSAIASPPSPIPSAARATCATTPPRT